MTSIDDLAVPAPLLPGSVKFDTLETRKLKTSNVTGNINTWKTSVRVTSTSDITLSGLQTIDGVGLNTDDRVLVQGQTNGVENGIYLAKNRTWARTRDYFLDMPASGTSVFVSEGTLESNAVYICTNVTGSDIVGTNSLVYELIAGGSLLPGGPDLAVQYNDNGTFGGSANFLYDGNITVTLNSILQNLVANDLNIITQNGDGTNVPNNLNLLSGSGNVLDNPGGDLNIASGDGSGTGAGGGVDINSGGNAAGTGDGGSISLTSGNSASANPGDIVLTGGESLTGNTTESGTITLTSGIGENVGGIQISTSDTNQAVGGTIGDLLLTSGSGGTTSGDSGDVVVTLGDIPTGGNGTGGNFSVTGGSGTTGGNGGGVSLVSGLADIGVGGVINIEGGSTVSGTAGIVNIIGGSASTGTSGSVTISSGSLSDSAGTSGNVLITTEGTGYSNNASAGNIQLIGGNGDGTGGGGSIELTSGTGAADGNITITASDSGGTPGDIILVKSNVSSSWPAETPDIGSMLRVVATGGVNTLEYMQVGTYANLAATGVNIGGDRIVVITTDHTAAPIGAGSSSTYTVTSSVAVTTSQISISVCDNTSGTGIPVVIVTNRGAGTFDVQYFNADTGAPLIGFLTSSIVIHT